MLSSIFPMLTLKELLPSFFAAPIMTVTLSQEPQSVVTLKLVQKLAHAAKHMTLLVMLVLTQMFLLIQVVPAQISFIVLLPMPTLLLVPMTMFVLISMSTSVLPSRSGNKWSVAKLLVVTTR